MSYTIGVIGGGAAGMLAAIAAAREGASVTILERNEILGKKILVTGNGKCNLTNKDLSIDHYYSENLELVSAVLEKFNGDATLHFFEELGLLTKDKDGYVYPYNDQAASVRDVLENAIKALGISVVYGVWVKKISYCEDQKQYKLIGNKKEYCFDRVIIACGGQAAPKTGSDGGGFYLASQCNHTIHPVVPGLVQLKCRESWLKNVAGVRTECCVTVVEDGREIAKEFGELQLTENGISGIPVFQISRVVNLMLQKREKVSVRLNFLPEMDSTSFADEMYQKRRTLMKTRTVEEYFTGVLNKKLMKQLILFARLDGTEKIETIPEEIIKKVWSYACSLTVQVIGSNSFDSAQVSTGGVPLTEITTQLESRLSEGVYFAGEVLDVDGKCGGYNLQWAWSSGMIAGTAAAGGHLC